MGEKGDIFTFQNEKWSKFKSASSACNIAQGELRELICRFGEGGNKNCF